MPRVKASLLCRRFAALTRAMRSRRLAFIGASHKGRDQRATHYRLTAGCSEAVATEPQLQCPLVTEIVDRRRRNNGSDVRFHCAELDVKRLRPIRVTSDMGFAPDRIEVRSLLVDR